MKADALSPRELFQGSVHYEIPVFQRPYVWSREDQWEPLWQDVKRVAEKLVCASGDAEALDGVGGHFLGAIVLKSKPAMAGDVTRHAVIDGQQRTTTLQLLLDAAQEAIAAREHQDEGEALEELIVNKANRFKGKPERFKLWPSRSDQAPFEQAMDDTDDDDQSYRIGEAHSFFRAQVEQWLIGDVGDDQQPAIGSEDQRVAALSDTLQNRLYVVAINLAGRDDDQVIFETLNDRGTPLLKADLIKNWVFQRGEEVGASIEQWPETHWVDFDDEWWREEIRQGRQMRSRIDIFLQYWLTMRTTSEILTEEVFRRFMAYAKPLMSNVGGAEELLSDLRRDADTFRSFAEFVPESPEGRFYARVIEGLELGATTPLLLWMVSANHKVPDAQRERALGALESWAIRRTLLRYTMQGVNNLMVSILADLDDVGVAEAGDRVVAFLAGQQADARSWPKDDEVVEALPKLKLYGNVRQARLRVVLEAIEAKLRSEKSEATAVPAGLEVEHVMPQGWRQHWDTQPPLDPNEAAERDAMVNRLGNLTLLTKKLNGSLSNRPWTNGDADVVSGLGDDAALGKRSLISKYSLLVLSRELVEQHAESWTEADIENRSIRLSKVLCEVWPRPE